jgi:hypothetical protein
MMSPPDRSFSSPTLGSAARSRGQPTALSQPCYPQVIHSLAFPCGGGQRVFFSFLGLTLHGSGRGLTRISVWGATSPGLDRVLRGT